MKIYRIAYIVENGEPSIVNFSGWVRQEDLGEVKAELLAVNPPRNGSPGGVAPTFLGAEEMKLENLDDLLE